MWSRVVYRNHFYKSVNDRDFRRREFPAPGEAFSQSRPRDRQNMAIPADDSRPAPVPGAGEGVLSPAKSYPRSFTVINFNGQWTGFRTRSPLVEHFFKSLQWSNQRRGKFETRHVQNFDFLLTYCKQLQVSLKKNKNSYFTSKITQPSFILKVLLRFPLTVVHCANTTALIPLR